MEAEGRAGFQGLSPLCPREQPARPAHSRLLSRCTDCREGHSQGALIHGEGVGLLFTRTPHCRQLSLLLYSGPPYSPLSSLHLPQKCPFHAPQHPSFKITRPWLGIAVPRAFEQPHCTDKETGPLLFSRQVMSDTLQPHRLQHARLLCPSQSPGVCSNSRALNW